MALTFGAYLMTRRVNRATANPALIRRVQAAPHMAEVTTFDELVEVVGSFSEAEEIGIKIFQRGYRALLLGT